MRQIVNIVFFLLLCSIGLAYGQADTASIRIQLNEYFIATQGGDWETVVDMLYPPLFDQVSKADMIQTFQDLSGNGIEFEMSDFRIINIKGPVQEEQKLFASVLYNARMNLRFTSIDYQAPSVIAQLKQNFIDTYGEENVIHQPSDNSFDINARKSLYAIQSEGSGKWTFIESEALSNPVFQNLIPAAVANALKRP